WIVDVEHRAVVLVQLDAVDQACVIVVVEAPVIGKPLRHSLLGLGLVVIALLPGLVFHLGQGFREVAGVFTEHGHSPLARRRATSAIPAGNAFSSTPYLEFCLISQTSP